MSIAIERFGLHEKLSESRAWSRVLSLASPYRLQCRLCGFEADDAFATPPRCPKCRGGAWERYAIPRSLLMCADPYAGIRAAHSSRVGLYGSKL